MSKAGSVSVRSARRQEAESKNISCWGRADVGNIIRTIAAQIKSLGKRMMALCEVELILKE